MYCGDRVKLDKKGDKMNWELVVSICAMLITLFVCIANFISACYAKQSYIEDNKAYISFFFDSYYISHYEKIIIFKNFGKSEGRIFNIKFNNDLPSYVQDFFKNMENRTLMPGQQITCWIAESDKDIEINVEFEYATLNKTYKNTTDIDLSKSNTDLYTRITYIDDTNLPSELINVLKRIYTKL